MTVNVLDSGADPTGVNPSDDAFAQATASILGNSDPAVTSRWARNELYVPAGRYKLTRDWRILSSIGFRLRTDGQDVTSLVASGTGFTKALVDVDGSVDGTFSGLQLAGDGTETVPRAFSLDWSTAAARSTSSNYVGDLRVRDMRFGTGISLEGTSTRQLDGTLLKNIVVHGGMPMGAAPVPGLWQKGFAFGNGSWGNVYDQVGYGLTSAGCAYGIDVNVSSVAIYGSQPANNGTDIHIVPGGQCTFSNFQSQNAGQFLKCEPCFSPMPVSVSDILVKTLVLNPAQYVMDLSGGLWDVSNFSAVVTQCGGAYVPAKIRIAGTIPSRLSVASLRNIALTSPRISALVPVNAQLSVANYVNYNVITGAYAAPVIGDTLSAYANGTWKDIA